MSDLRSDLSEMESKLFIAAAQNLSYMKKCHNLMRLNILYDYVENLKTLKPTDKEWSFIEQICQYLNVFKRISMILEGESYATLPMVIIGINMLLDRLELWAMELDNKPDRDKIDENIINSIQAARDKII